MKKEDLKEKLKQEIESEASALERRVNTKKSLASLEMPEDSYEDLMKRIQAKEESQQESVDKPKRKVKIIPFGTRRKALATVAMVVVLVTCTGLGVNGARLYVLNARNRTQDRRVDIGADTEDVAYFELTEEEAYEKIEEEIGILALRLGYKPKGMKLGDVIMDAKIGEALMEFYYDDHILTIYQEKQNRNASTNLQADGVLVDKIDAFYLEQEIKILELDKKDGNMFYQSQIQYGNAYYYLSSDMELDDFKNILYGIIFKSE